MRCSLLPNYGSTAFAIFFMLGCSAEPSVRDAPLASGGAPVGGGGGSLGGGVSGGGSGTPGSAGSPAAGSAGSQGGVASGGAGAAGASGLGGGGAGAAGSSGLGGGAGVAGASGLGGGGVGAAGTSGLGGGGAGASGLGGASAGSSSAGSAGQGDYDFEEQGGMLVFEAEHFRAKTSVDLTEWLTFEVGTPELTECPKNITCPGSPEGNCNSYSDCDDDFHPAAEQSGAAYVEVLPNRRRDDSEPGTGGISVSDNPESSPQLWYRVKFNLPGTYYAWIRGYGKGPADNGLHLGLTQNDVIENADFRPDYGLPDYAGLRFQFESGWQWQNCRRGETQHTGVNDCAIEDNMRLEIPSPGVYNIVLAMREDGIDLDKLYFSQTPEPPSGLGPEETK